MESSNIASNAYADDSENDGSITSDEIQLVKEIYDSLSPEARKKFEASLASDPELVAFHQDYVDSSFTVEVPTVSTNKIMTIKATAAAPDPMSILNAKLALLSLPSAVVYSLKAVGAGIVAALADGPLPVGDILLIAAVASAIIVIALNWNAVYSKWSGIVNAFKAAFSASAKMIIETFNAIKSKIQSRLATNPCVTYSGRTITINGTKYNCNTKADYLSSSQKSGKKYYPAIRQGSYVYVAPTAISVPLARAVLSLNSKDVGIMTTTKAYARGISGANAKWHNVHDSSEGYYYHYHPSYATKAHCWYLF